MTDQDYKDLEAHQSSQEDSVYHAIFWLENAIDELYQSDSFLVLEYGDNIAAALLKLGHVLSVLTQIKKDEA